MIKVISAGIFTTVQDLGRIGFAHIGVSKSGVMDEKATIWANYLLQNDKNCAILEITLGNCALEFLEDTIICITGADFSPMLDRQIVPMYKPIKIYANSILNFSKRNYGIRTYLAVKNGFQTPLILGSRSYFNEITPKNRLTKGDCIPYEKIDHMDVNTNSKIKIDTSYFQEKIIICFPGPEFDWLTYKQKTLIKTTIFSISQNNNRMGYQLNEMIENNFSSMLTSAVLQGTVQLTPSGKLIILMRDCQVTGGYPRILQLTDEAINVLAQKTIGDSFRFELM